MALLSGCLSLPEGGPVSDVGAGGFSDVDSALYYVPPGPQAGASQLAVVNGFLDAMTAIPIQTTSAKLYLTEQAQVSWQPEAQTLVYEESAQPVQPTRRDVQVDLVDAYRLDDRGVFAGLLPDGETRLDFRLDLEAGEWRISQAPDALVVSRQWALDNFRTVDVYYLDPTGEILVPEPVSVPGGEQFVSSLMRSLAAGPGPSLRQVSRNYYQPGRLPTVVVDANGVADVTMDGGPPLTPSEAELASIQIAWTLRQEESIRSIRLTADGEALPGLSRDIALGEGAEYDPAAFSSTTDVFALRDGILVGGDFDDLVPVEGPFGQSSDYGVSEVALSVDSTKVAGVTESGTTLLTTSTHEPDGRVAEVVSDAEGLLRPSWDFADRLWLVDRTSRGARVSVVVGDRVRQLTVPGITNRPVKHFLVSRDGSRFLAVVRGRDQDRVVASRIRYDDRGAILSATPARKIPWPIEEQPRIADLAWETPTSFAVLYPLRGFYQVRTLAVDGVPSALTSPSSTITGDFRWLIGSPEAGTPLLVATPDSFTDLSRTIRTTRGSDVTLSTLTYTG